MSARLSAVSTASLTVQLRKRGLDNCFMEGLRPTRPQHRLVGVARTLRYVALREDVFGRIGGGMNAQKLVVDTIQPGEVLVIEARGERGAGTIGDILALRLLKRGAAGVITDGALRDSDAFGELELPAYYASVHASVLGRRHVPMDSDLPVTCAGVLVMPGDVIVGDADGALVIPADVVDEVATAATEQEREERYIYGRVAEGESLDGLFPLGPEAREKYLRWQEEQ